MPETATIKVLRTAEPRSIDRFAELMRLFREMYDEDEPGDVLHVGDSAYYTALLADSMRWARLLGLEPITHLLRACETIERERNK